MRKPWFVSFQADPCLLEHEGRLFLYYEDVLHGSIKGRLRCSELTANGTLAHRGAPMISLRSHAAYPYVFEHADTFYCVPETSTSNHVALYRATHPWALGRGNAFFLRECRPATAPWFISTTAGGSSAR